MKMAVPWFDAPCRPVEVFGVTEVPSASIVIAVKLRLSYTRLHVSTTQKTVILVIYIFCFKLSPPVAYLTIVLGLFNTLYDESKPLHLLALAIISWISKTVSTGWKVFYHKSIECRYILRYFVEIVPFHYMLKMSCYVVFACYNRTPICICLWTVEMYWM
jgi:hypothetical protein